VRTTLASLPDDIDALKRLVLEREERLELARSDLLVQTTLVEYLKLQIAKLKRLQFGRSSEKLGAQIDQLELIVEDLEATQAQNAAPPKAATPPKTPPARRPQVRSAACRLRRRRPTRSPTVAARRRATARRSTKRAAGRRRRRRRWWSARCRW
jgi:hypothetical protein